VVVQFATKKKKQGKHFGILSALPLVPTVFWCQLTWCHLLQRRVDLASTSTSFPLFLMASKTQRSDSEIVYHKPNTLSIPITKVFKKNIKQSKV
jgi:hypothetical protein